MAGNKIEYTFTGNTSQLNTAINSAIRMLDRYKNAISGASKTSSLGGSFKSVTNTLQSMQQRLSNFSADVKGLGSDKALNSFQEKFKDVSRTIEDTVNKYKNMGSIGFTQAQPEMDQFLDSVRKIDDLLGSMTERVDINSQQVGAYSTNLGRLNKELQTNASNFTSAMAKTDLWRQAMGKIQGAATIVSQKFRDMFKPFTQAAQNFMSTATGKVSNALTGMSQKAKTVKGTFTDTASSTAASFSKVVSGLGDIAQAVQRAIYKYQNYDRVQREVAKNAQQHAASMERIANYSGKGRKPKEIPLLSEDQIIDQMMAQGIGKSLTSGFGSIAKITRPINRIMSAAMKTLNTTGSTTLNVFKKLGSSIASVVRGLTTFSRSTNVASSSAKGLYNILKSIPPVLKEVVSQILQIEFGNWIGEAVSQSIALVENLNLFTVSMGSAADVATEFVDTMAELYGMNPSNLYRYAGYFAQITGAIGLTDVAAEKLATSMTKMSNDIASLYNVEIEQVVQNLGSGLQGLNQAVRKYGIDMRQTTVQQTAFKYGLTDNVATMSEANRVVLRYLTMIEQMRNAIKQTTEEIDGSSRIIGDFARNIETPANQLRILKEQVQQLAIAIGTFLIPVVQKLLPILNGVVAAVRMILQFFAQLFGIDASGWGGEISAGADIGAGGIDDLGDAAEDASKKMKDLLAPFDELHILNEDLSSGGGAGADLSDWGELDPKLLKALEDLQLALDDVRLKAWDVRDAILEIFGLTPEGDLIVGGFIDRIIKAFQKGNYVGMGREVANLFNQAIDWALENITWEKLGDSIKHALDIIIGNINGLIDDFNFYGLGNVFANIINIIAHTIEEAVDLFEWARLGEQIANGFNGLFENIEYDTVFRAIAKAMNGVYTSLLAFVTTIRWSEISLKIVEGLNAGIREWRPEILAAAIMEGINGAIKVLENFANNFDFNTLANKLFLALSIAIQGIEWYDLGNALMTGFMRAIEAFNDAVATYGDMGLSDAIFDFIHGAIDAVKPEELKEAITNLINGIIDFFKRIPEEFDVKETSYAFFKWIDEVIDDIDLDSLGESIGKIAKGIIEGFAQNLRERQDEDKPNIIDQFFDFIESIFEDFPWKDLGYILGNFVGTLAARLADFIADSSKWGPFVAGFIDGMSDAFDKNPEGWTKIKAILGAALIGILLGIPPQLLPTWSIVVGTLMGEITNFCNDVMTTIGTWIDRAIAFIVGGIELALGWVMSLLPGKVGEWGAQLEQDGRELLDYAFHGAQESIKENAPKVGKDVSDETDKILKDLERQLNTVEVVVSDTWEAATLATQRGIANVAGEVAAGIAEMVTQTNQDLDAWVIDMNGTWHQMNIDASEGIGGVVTTVNTAMGDMSDTATQKSEEIRKTMVDKLQLALSQIEGLEWERTGTEGVAKLRGGIETEWGNLDIYIDTATGQIIGMVQNMLDNPTYSTLAGNLSTLFRSTFSNMVSEAQSAISSINSYMSQGASANAALKQTLEDAQSIQSTINKINSGTQFTSPAAMIAANNEAKNMGEFTFATATPTSVFNTPASISTSYKSAREALNSGRYSTTTVNGQTVYKNPDGTTGKTWSTVAQKFFAKGGVVTGPTNAIIGEGRYNEAVIPLEGSPQMQQLVQSIADAVHQPLNRNGQQQQPIELTVKVQIGDHEWDTFVYESSQRGKQNVGENPVEVTS